MNYLFRSQHMSYKDIGTYVPNRKIIIDPPLGFMNKELIYLVF